MDQDHVGLYHFSTAARLMLHQGRQFNIFYEKKKKETLIWFRNQHIFQQRTCHRDMILIYSQSSSPAAASGRQQQQADT